MDFLTTAAYSTLPGHISTPLLGTPGKPSSRYGPQTSPLAPTPLYRGNDGVFTPNLFYGASGWGTPSWGGDDAKMLQEVLSSSRHTGAQSTAVTPGIIRSGNYPLTNTPSSHSKMNTPRVIFKDQLTETYNFNKPAESPLVVSPPKPVLHPIILRFLTKSSFAFSQRLVAPVA